MYMTQINLILMPTGTCRDTGVHIKLRFSHKSEHQVWQQKNKTVMSSKNTSESCVNKKLPYSQQGKGQALNRIVDEQSLRCGQKQRKVEGPYVCLVVDM